MTSYGQEREIMNASELIFVGMDIAKNSLELAMDDKSKTLTLDNDETGMAKLLALILAEEGRVGAVVLEATGGFEREAAIASCRAGLPVREVNPRQARDFAKAMGFLSKTDAIDARVPVYGHFERGAFQLGYQTVL